MKFFTSDTHFNHKNSIEYCKRPFVDVKEMNDKIIENWNSKVGKGDVVYHLGDVGFWDVSHCLNRLNGTIILIEGSHDRNNIKKYYSRFSKITSYLEISENKQPIVLCHYCFRVWSKSHYNSWHLYGHSHGMLPPIGKSWDVGVDNNNFFPLSFEEIKEIMAKRPDNPNFIKEEDRRKVELK